jgi:nucleotide-binding universal stress UspA family protein
VDGSRGSKNVLATIEARRWPAGSEALLFCAVDTRLALAPPNAFANELATARATLEQAAAGLRASNPDLTVVTLVREGEPRELLLEEAEEGRADSIFLGARGLGATERFLLGSVSTAVAMRAPCSVEVIYAPEATGTRG